MFYSLDYFALMTALHILGNLSTWNDFSTVLKEFSYMLTCWLLSLSSPSHPKSSRLGLGQMTVEARSYDAALWVIVLIKNK